MNPDPHNLTAPFLRQGPDIRGMMHWMLVFLSFTALHFSLRYDHSFFWRYTAWLAVGLGMEWLYTLLKDGRSRIPHASTAVTTALLILSVPARMPPYAVTTGILVAVVFGKLMVDRKALRLNPMLLGRLFMMLLFADAIQQWLPPDTPIEALTSATPLGFHAAEGELYPAAKLLAGNLRDNWNNIYAIVPGSPGDLMPLITLGFGLLLYGLGVLDGRASIAFVAGFASACALLGMPVLFHLLTGSIAFTAVYIVSDPRSMPGSRSGRWIAGLLAGILNALLRYHGYYPEGVVWAVLAVNLISPALDRMAFQLRASQLHRYKEQAR